MRLVGGILFAEARFGNFKSAGRIGIGEGRGYRSRGKSGPQRLKPPRLRHLMARVNSCPSRSTFLFRDTMLKLIASDNLEYKELTKVA